MSWNKEQISIYVYELYFRALVSKYVEDDEVGRIFAVMGIMAALSSSLGHATFQAIYSASLDVFPEAYLLVTACIFCVAIPSNFILRKKLSIDYINVTNQ